LILIAGKPDAIDVRRRAAHGRIAGEQGAQHDNVVIVAERRFGAVQGRGITIDATAPALQQPQLVPQRLDCLAPFVEVCRALLLPRARQRFSSTPVRAVDAGGKRAEAVVRLPPPAGRLSQRAEVAVDVFPGAAPLGVIHGAALLRREAPAYAHEGVFADQLRRPGSQLFQDLEHRAGITHARQRAIHRAHLLPRGAEMTAPVRVHDLQNRSRFLEALSSLMDRQLGRTARAPQPIPRASELLRCKAAQAARDGFVRLQSKRHDCLIRKPIIVPLFIAQSAPRARPLHQRNWRRR
jgi:hypothetical protein